MDLKEDIYNRFNKTFYKVEDEEYRKYSKHIHKEDVIYDITYEDDSMQQDCIECIINASTLSNTSNQELQELLTDTVVCNFYGMYREWYLDSLEEFIDKQYEVEELEYKQIQQEINVLKLNIIRYVKARAVLVYTNLLNLYKT